MVREIEGAFAGAPSGWRSKQCVGVLCASKEASRGVRDALKRSPRGLVWVFVSDVAREMTSLNSTTSARIRQLLWNEQVASMGAEGCDVGLKYASTESLEKEIVLTYNGESSDPVHGGA